MSDEDCILEVLEGYKYCDECLALTPHRTDENNSEMCSVCGNRKLHSSEPCDHCGYSFPNVYELNPESLVVTNEDGEKFTIFPAPFVFNYKRYPIWNEACPDPIGWEFDIRCPICGTINHFEDTNC